MHPLLINQIIQIVMHDEFHIGHGIKIIIIISSKLILEPKTKTIRLNDSEKYLHNN